MSNETLEDLKNEIANAARKAFSSLFSEHPENFYYCTLVTTGEAHSPVMSAWSEEALRRVADENSAALELKWSAADSPYYAYGEEHFSKVNELFDKRPQITAEISDQKWHEEYQVRLNAMEEAMRQLDSEGLFGESLQRDRTVVLVEVQPPDSSNAERAKSLNPTKAIELWLKESGE